MIGKLVAGKRAFAGRLPKRWGAATIMRQRGVWGEELAHLLYRDLPPAITRRMFDPRRSPGIIRAYGWEGRNFVVTLDLTAFATLSR